ncbi:MAG: hypothetical protein OHK0057_27380 [Thermoflexibacter sp.]
MFDLQFQYNPLFTIEIRHDYFLNNAVSQFVVEPSSASVKIISKLGLMFKKSENGFHLIYDRSDIEKMIYVLNKLDENEKLTFYIYTKYPYFVHVTNISQEINKKILYFSNLTTFPDKDKIKECLHSTPFVSNQNVFDYKSRIFEHRTQKSAGKVDVMDELGRNHIVDKEAVEHRVQLKLEREGKYKLLEDGRVIEEFVCIDFKQVTKPVAVIDIYLDGKIKEKILKKLQENISIFAFNYYIVFENRHTYWKYYIIPKFAANLSGLSIIPIEEEVTFQGPTVQILPNGQKAIVFESLKALALKEVTQYHFQLKKGDGTPDNPIKTLMDRLPVPNVSNIKPFKVKNEMAFSSEIFVYV